MNEERDKVIYGLFGSAGTLIWIAAAYDVFMTLTNHRVNYEVTNFTLAAALGFFLLGLLWRSTNKRRTVRRLALTLLFGGAGATILILLVMSPIQPSDDMTPVAITSITALVGLVMGLAAL